MVPEPVLTLGDRIYTDAGLAALVLFAAVVVEGAAIYVLYRHCARKDERLYQLIGAWTEQRAADRAVFAEFQAVVKTALTMRRD